VEIWREDIIREITLTSRAGAQSTPKSKPLSTLPINKSRAISYNILTVTFVTTFNCNTIDNIYVKISKPLGSQNRQSDPVNKYSSKHSLKMAYANRKMSL